MIIPTVAYPTFILDLPSTGQKVKYRPFLVKEEKIFLMALESQDVSQMLEATKDIIDACTFNKLNVNKLPTYDIEYLLVKLRSKSKGEIVPITYTCTKFMEDTNGEILLDPITNIPIPCGKKKIVNLNLDLVEVVRENKTSDTVVLDESSKLSVKFKFPTFNDVKKTNFRGLFESDPNAAMKVIYDSVELIYNNEDIYSTKDFSLQDFIEWVDEIPGYMFDKLQNHIQEFYDSMPKVQGKIDYTCACGKYKQTILVEGLSSFFA